MKELAIGKKKVRINFRTIFPFLGLIVVIVFFQAATGGLFTARNIRAMVNDGLYILLGSVGYLFLLAQGNLDFSIGPNMGVCCAVACIAANSFGVPAAVLAALVTGSAIGLVNGLVFTKGRIGTFIVTLAMQFVLSGLLLVILNGSNMAAPLAMLKIYSDPLKAVLAAVFIVVGFIVFEYTPYGKACRAIGSRQEVVRQSGLRLTLLKIMPFVIMGTICGLLGFLSLTRTGTASSSTGGSLLMNVLSAVLLGGLPISGGPTAKFRAVIVGTLTMTFLATGMTIMGLSTVVQQIVKGLVFLVAISISFDRRNMKIIK